ncbi:MAG: mucoidy inhibitor MuiA family protein [Flavobacteriales bacterium]|nr:mucoidy inhibitor MuiA family protein [Flavobacteriales bacterium]
MKKLIALLLIVSTGTSFAAADEVTVSSKVNHVTVFLNGAQVFRKAKVTLKKGISEIVFDSISSGIDANSIQVKGKGNYIILDTKYKVVHPNANPTPPEIPQEILAKIRMITDSLDMINFDLEEVRYKKDVLELEKQLLTGNKSMKSDSLALLKDALSFYREKYNDINATLIAVKKQEYLLNKKKTGIEKRLNKIHENNNKKYLAKAAYPKYQIVVTVSADAPAYGSLDVNYLVTNASWSPKYDLRADGVNSPVELTYKANVYQNSGENWDDVLLTLSTNNPYKSKVKPILPVWYLNYYNPTVNYKRRYNDDYQLGRAAQPLKSTEMEMLSDKEEDLDPAQTSAYYASMNENMTNIEFSLSIPYSIPSDGQNHLVAIKNEQLDAKYQYYMVPKLDKDAFLVADVRGFEELNLLPAEANVYFEGTYIGNTMLNPNVTGDSLAITLGRDERLSINRKLLKQEEKEKFLGDSKIKYFTYELTVKNNRINDVDIIIEDQIPMSTLDDIKVGLLSSEKAKYVEGTGMLTWSFKLPAKENKTMKFKYSVQYDKDKQLALN